MLANALATGTYEPDTVSVLRKLAKPGMTMLDIGANVGIFSLLAARLVGEKGIVWAFEPLPHLRALLIKNIEDNGLDRRFHIVPQAVSNFVGAVSIHVNISESMRSSLYKEAATVEDDAALSQVSSFEASCTTLDRWAAEHAWPPVDFIKMDIEGAEKAALEGMRELSDRNPYLKLIIEFNPKTMTAAQVTPEDLVSTLQAGGFRRISSIRRGLPGQVSIALVLDTTRMKVLGQGIRRQHMRQVITMYRVMLQGMADSHGRFSRLIHIPYRSTEPMLCSITATVRMAQGTATGKTTTTILPGPSRHSPSPLHPQPRHR